MRKNEDVMLGAMMIASCFLIISLMVYIKNLQKGYSPKQHSVAECVSSYVGYNVSGYDWAANKNKPTNELVRESKLDSPHPENVINDCLGRL